MGAREQATITSQEKDILNYLYDKANVVKYHGSFYLKKLERTHLCLVMDLSGPSIRQYIEFFGCDPDYTWEEKINMRINICYECTWALEKIQDAQIVHGGKSNMMPFEF